MTPLASWLLFGGWACAVILVVLFMMGRDVRRWK